MNYKKEEQFKKFMETTTEMNNHNLHVAVQSAAMIREILVLFTDKGEPELLSAGKKLYNNMIQDIASELLELCFIDEKV
jgi:hypothetical protein